jgi:hypothetical protein
VLDAAVRVEAHAHGHPAAQCELAQVGVAAPDEQPGVARERVDDRGQVPRLLVVAPVRRLEAARVDARGRPLDLVGVHGPAELERRLDQAPQVGLAEVAVPAPRRQASRLVRGCGELAHHRLERDVPDAALVSGRDDPQAEFARASRAEEAVVRLVRHQHPRPAAPDPHQLLEGPPAPRRGDLAHPTARLSTAPLTVRPGTGPPRSA